MAGTITIIVQGYFKYDWSSVSAGLTSVIIKKALDSTAYTTLVSSNQLEKTEATFLMEIGLSAQSNQF